VPPEPYKGGYLMATMKTRPESKVTETENEENIEEVELTEEETQTALKAKEDDFISGLLQAAEDGMTDFREFKVIRGGKFYFSFRLHGLTEQESKDCRNKYTKYVKNRALGTKFADEVDTVKYHSSLIYHATADEDRRRLWDNRMVWKGLEQQGKPIINALDVIENTLLAGEKDRAIDVINDLSGFNSDDIEQVQANREETAKN